MTSLEIQAYEIFKNKLGEKEAEILIQYFDNKAEERINQKKDVFLTKDDKVEIMKAIYSVGIIQFFAIVGSVLAIVKLL